MLPLWSAAKPEKRVSPEAEAVLLPPSAEPGLSGARRGQPCLPTGPGGDGEKATRMQCPSVTLGRAWGWGPCPPQETVHWA